MQSGRVCIVVISNSKEMIMSLLSHTRPPISNLLSAMYSDVRPLIRVEAVQLLQSANNQIATHNLHSAAGVSDFMLVMEFMRMYGSAYTVSQAPISTMLSSAEMFALNEYHPLMDVSTDCDCRSVCALNIMMHKYAIHSAEDVPSADIMRGIVWKVYQMSMLQIVKSILAKPSDRLPMIWGIQHYEESGEFMLNTNSVNFAKTIFGHLISLSNYSKEIKQKLFAHHIASAIDKVTSAAETAALISLHRKPNMEALKNDKVI